MDIVLTSSILEAARASANDGFRVLERKDLASRIHLLRIAAPAIAAKAQAGQFLILRVDEEGERIPMTIADWSPEEGSITVVFMEVGASTMMLATVAETECILDVVGPLGVPSEIENYGHVVCVAGGVGVAPVFPIARAMKQAGNRVTSILGARTKDLVFWEDHLRSCSDELIVTTDDGSYGRHGLVTAPLAELLETDTPDRVVAIGPTPMMKSCAQCTEPYNVKSVVSLNPIMVDGTGMCGCCRVSVGDNTKFTCVDGPEFDGHLIDWEEFMARQKTYHVKEPHALQDCKWRAYIKTFFGGEEV